MSKLGPILGAIVGLVFTAFGMPFLGAIVGTLISAAVSVALKPDEPDAPFIGWDNNQTNYDPLAPMKILIGEGRTGGRVLYKQTTDNRNDMWLVIAFGPGPVEDIHTLWMGPEAIPITGAANGSVQGNYANELFVWYHLGDPDQTVDTNLQAAFPHEWTSDHRLRGIAYIVLNLDYNANLYGRGVPNPSVSFKGLNDIVDTRTGTSGFSSNPIMAIRHMLRNSVWGGKAESADFDFSSLDEEADYCDALVATPGHEILCGYRMGRPFTAAAATDILSFQNGFGGDDAELGFRLADQVKVASTTTLPGGLSAGVVYYAIPQTNAAGSFTMKVATTAADARAGVAINITSAGTGTHTCMPASYRLWIFGNDADTTVDSGSANTVSFDAFGSSLPTRRHYRTATKVLFYGTTAPAPLVFGTTYYAHDGGDAVFPQSMQVATSVTNAEAGTGIELTTAGSAVKVRFLGHGGTVTADAGTDLLTLLEEKGYRSGDRVTFATATTLPAPLQPGRAYYVIRVSATTFRVAETMWKALRGRYIDLMDTGSGAHSVHAEVYEPDKLPALSTGSVIHITSTEEGTIGGGISLNTDYYVINRGSHQFELAASLADAYAGTPIINSSSPVDGSAIHRVRQVMAPRFTLNGHFTTDQPIGDVLQAMLTSIGGYADPSGGIWRILCARYRGPHLTLTKDDIFSEVTLTTLLTADKRTNTIKGTYQSAANLDEASDVPVLVDADALEEDGGITYEADSPLPFTNTEQMALRLNMIALERAGRQKVLEFTTDLAAGWPIALGDSIVVDLPALGSDTYECLSWGLRMDEVGGGGGGQPPAPMVPLLLRQNDVFIYRD